MLERLFGIRARGSSVKTEILAGLTTFVTMAYIIVVNPAILSFAGIPVGPSTVATILTAVFGCLLMGFYANRPFGVAPYMGENAFIAFGLATLGITWQIRLGAVFLGGVLFLILSFFGIRQWLASSISSSLKHAFAVGIGLFLSFIGLYETGIVTSAAAGMDPKALAGEGGMLKAPDVPVKIGDFHNPEVLLSILGFFLIVALMRAKVKGAILLGIVATALVGGVLGYAEAPKGFFAVPFQGETSLAPIFMQMDLASAFHIAMLPVILTLMIMAFLDTTGTLVGLGAAANMLDEKGEFPDVHRPMIVDAVSCMVAPALGTSTTGAYIESAAGIREGAKTGLTAVVVGLLFALSLFFVPLLTPLQSLEFAYGPALIAVGILMLPAIRNIDFDDLTEAVPAFLAIGLTVFTYNIANGLSASLVAWPLMKLLGGKAKEVRAGSWLLGALCLAYYLVGLKH